MKQHYILEFRGLPGMWANESSSWSRWRKWKAYKTKKSMEQALKVLNKTTWYGLKHFEYRIKED